MNLSSNFHEVVKVGQNCWVMPNETSEFVCFTLTGGKTEEGTCC